MGASQLLQTLLSILNLCSRAWGASDEAYGTLFQNYGIVLFRGFDMIDIYGPLEVIQFAASYRQINVSLISETMNVVTTERLSSAMNPMNSSVWPTLPPTHTFETAPVPDVLIIPGGPGMRSPDMNRTLKYIAETAPKVKLVITICTGSGLAARAGIMNGRKATTNKTSWPSIIGYGPNTTWIGHARWVEDESRYPPVWSSSGVTSGLDLMFHFVETFYGADNATFISTIMEYERHRDPSWDPFARNDTVTR
ncbi:class I glutamine amidotransferase-like protein [Lophiostoma macrostomum CBS 122681]|uniref:Class I glutamine amidotransferase-like protein n=1 Tax=Lophiostoma macrostomum CBS 122681 TaxID=1314788 RepID=A0A6A6SP53_9PLEO|nr:class I glutamine amidotransferase-like protein [Lophiostoma macrostomum CBS 122681]